MGDEKVDAEVRVLGGHSGLPSWLGWMWLVFGAFFVVLGLVSGTRFTVAQGLFWLLLAALSRWLPATRVDEHGVRRMFREPILWTNVAEVEEPTGWSPVRLQLDDGRVIVLAGLKAEHVPGMRVLAGLANDDDPAGEQ